MSSTRYLEFDSTYRDRNLYPSPANFIIQMSQSGQGDKLTAIDPVSDASPILYWNNNFIEGTGAQNYIAGLTVDPAIPNQGNTVFLLKGDSSLPLSLNKNNALKQVRNFYVGADLCYQGSLTGATGSKELYVVPPVTVRRIIDYQPLCDIPNSYSAAMVTLDCPLPDSLVGYTGFYIENPTPIPTDTGYGTDLSTIKFYIPGSNQCLQSTERTQNYGFGGDNYYINYYVMNTDTGTYRKIVGFDALTRLATLDSPTPSGEDWSSSAYALSNFVIRKTIPQESSFGSGSPIGFATETMVQLVDLSPYAPPTNTYNGDFLRISPQVEAPTPYNITTSPPYSAAVAAAFPKNCQTEERRIQKYVYGRGIVLSGSGAPTTTVRLDSFSRDYIGAFISDLNITPVNPTDYLYPATAKITGYDEKTDEIKTDVPINWTTGDNWLIRTCILSSPFSVVPNPENLYEIELFSRDNYNPFIYTGSLVSSQEVVCYEVELLNLILPNAVLASGRGGRPIFYPYLYVELQQISSGGSANRNIIYSNNPHSYRMLFRAVVDDTPIPAISPFIKIDGDGMVHTIKFKPNDAFRFAVYHADGELFKTGFQEQFGPTAPNPLVQISACFAFKRV